MNMKSNKNTSDELRSDYADFSSLLKGGDKGKYYKEYQKAHNVVLLNSDVAKEFPDEKSVNEALRLVIKLRELTPPVKNTVAVEELER